MTSYYNDLIIVTYLAKKLGVDDSWLNTKQDFLFDMTPLEVVVSGNAGPLIEWLESRLGLIPGAGF